MMDQHDPKDIVRRIVTALAAMRVQQRDTFLAILIADISYIESAHRIGRSIKKIECEFTKSLLAIQHALNSSLLSSPD